MFFIYTDGIPEAVDESERACAMNRLIDRLNASKQAPCGRSCPLCVRISALSRVTRSSLKILPMLGFAYYGSKGRNTMKEMSFEAVLTNIPEVTAFIDAELEAVDCGIKTQMQLDVAIDELFTNISSYAYGTEVGVATVRFDFDEQSRMASVTFIDTGVPFDPTRRSDPDITLSAEERPIGGLGIYLVKKTMDDVSYRWEDGKNILTIRKKV